MSIPKKVFVSYKYSDVVEGREDKFNFRDELIDKLGGEGFRHKGEDDESFDLSDYNREQIVSKIAPDIKNSSLTIVLITPNAKYSKWIPWEISLSLRERTYETEKNMTRNGIIGLYLPLNRFGIPELGGSYDFYISKQSCGTTTHHTNKFPKMIEDNTFNLKNGFHKCSQGCHDKVYDSYEGSFIELIKWDDFINDIDSCIERAWNRRNNFENYNPRINLVNGE